LACFFSNPAGYGYMGDAHFCCYLAHRFFLIDIKAQHFADI